MTHRGLNVAPMVSRAVTRQLLAQRRAEKPDDPLVPRLESALSASDQARANGLRE